jgi:biotin carboxyl carrier protein
MWKAVINEVQHEVQWKDKHNGVVVVNGKELTLDMVQSGDRDWHILLNGKATRITLVNNDKAEKQVLLMVNGQSITVNLKDRLDQLLSTMGLENAGAKKMNELKSPMPGLVLKLRVNEGDSVKKGDPLLVLEAMKMENVIKAADDAVVSKIVVSPGQAVEKNALLMSFK